MPESPVRARLTRLSGKRAGEKIELPGGSLRIGSSPFSDVKFEGDEVAHVAPVHAKIVFHQGVHWLYDNQQDDVATLVNGEKISNVALRPGDELRFGENGPTLRYETNADEEPTLPPFQGARTEAFDKTLIGKLAGATPATPPAPVEADLTELTMVVAPTKGSGASRISTAGLARSTEHTLDKPVVTIGRSAKNDIVLEHPQVSARHAEILQDGPRHILVDGGSANGTFVGTQRVSRRVLEEDDEVRIGPFLLVFHKGALFAYGEAAATTIDVVHVTKEVGGGLKLLDDVSLRLAPGELIGLIGPSGAGKSTLLGVLNGQRRATSGHVLVNGLDLQANYDSLKSNIGFVPQDDIIHAELTPQRTLHYVSLMRLQRDTSRAERDKRISDVMQLLELGERRAVPIHRLSGGQRKRVSIGVELLTEPQLLFLDEPTAGLDPALESKMMVLFRELAHRGKTVVVTTHVMENVHLFDKLCVLVRGKLAFYGSPEEAKKHFGISDMRGLYDKLATAEPDEWRKRFQGTALHAQHVTVVDQGKNASQASEVDAALLRRRAQGGGLFAGLRQLFVLARRQTEILLRDRRNTALLLAQAPVVAGFIALAMDSAALITFMLALSAIWFGTTNAAKEIVKELPIYRRERMVNLRILPYVASKALVLSLLAVIQCALLVGVVEAFRHVPGDPVQVFLTLLLSSVTGVLMGLAISALVETTDKATALVPLILIPQVLFAGVFTPLTGLSGAVGNVMPTRWSYDLLKRVVVRTNRDAEPPLIDFAEKAKAERELAAIESHTHAVLLEIDSKAAVASAACARADVTRREMNDSLGHMGEHEKALIESYDRSRAEMATIESQTEAIGKALERERRVAREIQSDLATLSGSKPEAARALLTPEWAAERRARLEEAANAYGEVEQSVAAIEKSKKALVEERGQLEGRAKDARRIEGDLKVGKDRLEQEGAVLVAAAEAIHDLEGALKADASRVKEIQAEVTTNLRLRRYVQFLPRDSIELDAAALGAFCLVLGVVTLGLQKLRDGEA